MSATTTEAPLAKIDFASRLPLGTIQMKRIGWDASRIIVLGRASWDIKRDGFAAVVVSYRNLIDGTVWPLGDLRSDITNNEIVSLIAEKTDSLTAGDWIVANGRVIAALAADRGIA